MGQPYNVSAAAEVAACTALENVEDMNTIRDLLVGERGVMMRQLETISYLEPYKSHSNFILCKVKEGMDAQDLKQRLQGYIRISVGMPEQTQILMAALRDIDDDH